MLVLHNKSRDVLNFNRLSEHSERVTMSGLYENIKNVNQL